MSWLEPRVDRLRGWKPNRPQLSQHLKQLETLVWQIPIQLTSPNPLNKSRSLRRFWNIIKFGPDWQFSRPFRFVSFRFSSIQFVSFRFVSHYLSQLDRGLAILLLNLLSKIDNFAIVVVVQFVERRNFVKTRKFTTCCLKTEDRKQKAVLFKTTFSLHFKIVSQICEWQWSG